MLWQRESATSRPSDANGTPCWSRIMARVAAFVGRRRPDLGAADLNLLAWACLDVAASTSFQRIDLPVLDLLAGIIDRVVATDLDLDRTAIRAPHPPADLDRRDELLAAGRPGYFAQRGYHSVGVEDAGATACAWPGRASTTASRPSLHGTPTRVPMLDGAARALADARDDAEALNAPSAPAWRSPSPTAT